MPPRPAKSCRPHHATSLVVLALGVACGPRQGGPVTRTDSSGIEIVVLEAELEELPWRADTVLLLGGKEDGPQSFYQVRAQLIDVDADGRIVVLDPSRHRVVVFDATGAALAEMGREGEGPGEFRGPLGVAVSDGGEVAVHDGSRGAVIRFGLDRSILPQQAYPFSIITNRLRHIEIVPGGTVMWARDRFAGSDDRFDRLLLVSADDTVELVAGKPTHTATAQYPACGMTFTMSIPLSPNIHWAQWGKRIAVALWGEDRVDLFDGPRLTRSLRLAPAGPELSEGDAVRILEDYGTRGPCNATPRELVRKHGFSPRLQSVLGLAVAPDGTIWVGRRRDGERRIALFDSTGAPVGLLAPGFPMPLNFLPDGRPLIAVRDSLDVERLGIVRIHR